MQALPIIQVDAFTTTAYGGNPCAVVFDADALDEAAMQAIAREMNLSETAFVMDSEVADHRARYFTPAGEIPMAGHPTIATVYGLLSTGRLHREGDFQRLTLELPAGVIEVEVTGSGEGHPLITMTQPAAEFYDRHDPTEVATALGLTVEDLLPGVPVQTVSTGTPQLMVPLVNHGALERARVQLESYSRLREFGGFFSPHLFVQQGATPEGDVFSRHFGVPPDLPEDPFTGSATGGMAAYLWRYGLIREPRFVAEQGHWMGRPGRAYVEVLGDDDDIRGVRVGGYAVEIMEGMILAP